MKKFITLLPPPNITGALHIGHYFNWLLQDFLIKYKTKQGFETQWILGLDHAGIATQYVVERQLAEKNESRTALGREKFNKRIWEWKKEAESLIEEQVKNFQFDMNWDERNFTMSQEHQERVKDAFIKLYNDGLITKKSKITNWDTKFHTAISDLEVVEKKEKSKIYLIEYKSATGDESLFVATTRPETIFADSALCLNPEDERAPNLNGKKFLIPLVNREIPVILDELCQKEKGLGVLKVTPAHDPLDNEIGEKHNLPQISIINQSGTLFNTIDELNGLTVKEARKKILEIFKEKNINCEEKEWEGIKKYTEKSNVPLESILTDQWFLDVKPLAEAALKASEEITFYPEHLRNVFEYWLNNIKPWCISRQIWWGHQIPIWYTEKGETICAKNIEEAQKNAPGEVLTQETDVLDTWFSSALWANLIEEQIDVLITGKDILFFWVARMIMFSLYLYKKNPFKSLYFNGIVRDAQNQKMSKTKGNVINPMQINEKYGQDALRFTLLKQTAGNKDIKLNEKDVELSRNFITKIKNADSFLKNFMSKEYNTNQNLDNWMSNQIDLYKKEIDKAIENYEFQQAAELFYDVFWNSFCNWYIEGLKDYPSENALPYFYDLLSIGYPFLPITIKEILPKEHFFNTQEQKPSDFNKVIQISKFLRKIKKHTKAESFASPYEPKLLERYSKLKQNEQSAFDFKMTLEKENIYIDKAFILEVKSSILKEIDQEETEKLQILNKIQNAKNVPEEVLAEWKKRLNDKDHIIQELQSWISNI